MKNKKVLIIANLDVGLYKFRKHLIQELLDQGNEVFISLPKGELIADLQEMGCHFLETDLERRGMNPIKDLKLIFTYLGLIRKVSPDWVITYTIKPNIYGGIAASILKTPYAVNITGLGTAFQRDNFIKKLVIFLYRQSCKKAKTVFFENQENRDVFLKYNIVEGEQTCLLPGAGVDLQEYRPADYPEDSVHIRFLFIGRMMKEKGVDELLEAAQRLKERYPQISFDLVGPMEDDYKHKIQSMEEKGILHYYGYQKDVKPFIRKSHCLILPSYHEGMANTLLEAGAMGRPLITSKIHGCMEAVEEGKNGWLVDVKDVRGLERQMSRFIELPWEEKKKMGEMSWAVMSDKFDKRDVIRMTVRELSK